MTESSPHPTTPLHAASAPRPLGLSDRLAPVAAAVLRGAAKGLACEQGGFEAGELWLLDDATQSLGLAARWSRNESPTTATRRRLADAPAEVAALAGGAVVLETASEAEAWDLPTDRVAAAICLPVSSDTTIHGVLWLTNERPLALADEVVELAEIVAGRLALEVERNADSALRNVDARIAESVSIAHSDNEPSEPEQEPSSDFTEGQPAFGNPQSAILSPVETAAWTASHATGVAESGCWELADQRLLTIAVVAIDSPESTQATQQAAVEWLLSEAPGVAARVIDAGQLLTLLNRRLLDCPLAGEGLAVAAALVDAPEDAAAGLGGTGTWAFAGPAAALSVRAAATESHVGDLIPLGWTEPQAAYAPRPFELAVRQRLVLVAGDPRMTSPLVERRLGDVYRAATADAHREMTAEGCLRRLASAGVDEALAAVALRRD
ncbi:hypothetical protein MalM25_34990 [Planctomycetes bacterium MalM25]|nr:hypothetical protein MalM25_34990 [Planctomycetes bacterium MalM25]